jgi:hypothetical protein
MQKCRCTEYGRCDEAHAIRDAHVAARSLSERMAQSARYTEHLYAAGLMAYPTTATPRWVCAQACKSTAPCRHG